MKQSYRNIKGTFDILPIDHSADGSEVASSAQWQFIESTIRRVLGRYHFAEIRTPYLEPEGLFERSVGVDTDIVSKEMFTVPRPKETYVLRPEVTASVMRAYLQHHLAQQPLGQRLFYIGPCFRAERPQKGRFRQFHQFGAELIGSADPLADAEVIAAMIAVVEALGLEKLALRLNTLGSGDSRGVYVQALKEYLSRFERDLTETSRRRLVTNPLRILDTKVEHEREILADAPRLRAYVSDEDLAHYESVKSYLEALDLSYEEDPLLVRGLDYYCRTAFELESPNLGAQSAIAGGGRYDGLAQAIGWNEEVPGVGFAAGIERLLLALQLHHNALPAAAAPDLYLVTLGMEAGKWAFGLARDLRRLDITVALDVRSRSMKAQMKQANKLDARYVVIIGDAELDAGEVILKQMEEGTQQTLSFAGITEKLADICRSS